MYKGRPITDFFKPFANPRPAKRRKEEFGESDRGSVFVEPSLPPRSIASTGDKSTGTHQPGDLSKEPQSTSSLTSLSSDIESPDHDVIRHTNSSFNARHSRSGSLTIPQDDPPSSRGQTFSSSQRVVKDGVVVVKNSDDETTDSEGSLADIDDLLNPRKSTSKSSPLTEPEIPEEPLKDAREHKNGIRRSGRNKNPTAKTSRVSTLPTSPKYKFSLDSLVAQTKRDDEAELGAEQARTLLGDLEHEAVRRKTDGGERSTAEDTVDADLVATAVRERGSGDDVDRLLNAIQRTEALHRGKSWPFFDDRSSTVYKQPDFPANAGTQCWKSILRDPFARQQAILTGYLGEVATRGKLPEEILLWIIDTLPLEGNQDLRSAYVLALKNAGQRKCLRRKHHQRKAGELNVGERISGDCLKSSLTPDRIDLIFRKLGTRKDALDLNVPAVPTPPELAKGATESYDSSRLVSVLSLFAGVGNWLTTDARMLTISILFRLALDISVVSIYEVLLTLEDAFASLVGAIEEGTFKQQLTVILSSAYSCTNDTQLRLLLLKTIPSSTPRLHLLRRRLALAWFFNNSSYLVENSPNLINFPKLTRFLQKRKFQIRSDTDYPELSASIALLNIGLDDGDPPHQLDKTHSQESAEEQFNEQVDGLADAIKTMFTQIVDTGASHMSRTEAKDELESFHSRLVYAVRTKPVPKKPFFDEEYVMRATKGNDQGSMRKFLTKMEESGESKGD